MERKFDAFARQLEIGKLRRKLKEKRFEEKQERKIKVLKQETFRRSPTGRVVSRTKVVSKRLGALAQKALKAPKGKTGKPPKLKSFFGESPKDVGFFGKPLGQQTFEGGLIGSPFPEQKKKNKDSI